ncbi:MAG: ATP-binding protein [Rhodocyclaceae bacterium]|nr:ATP-binding protein [Rhodocyclaceae bacterium]
MDTQRVPEVIQARVLVVDDDPILQAQLMHLLGKFVTEVRVAGNGADGLALWREWQPNVTLTDILMPVMDGLEMSLAIKAEDPDAQIVVITADRADANLRQALDIGVERYITKPVDVHLLLDAIRKCVRDRRHSDELHLARQVAELTQQLQRQLADKERAEAALQREKAEQQVLIQKLEEAHNQLLQSEKMASLGQLAAGVAHEINNPVGFVSSNLGTLRTYAERLLAVMAIYEKVIAALPADSVYRQMIEQARQAADVDYLKEDMLTLIRESAEGVTRVRQIVLDLKVFSHVDAVEWQATDLHRCIDSTLNLAAHAIKYKAEVVKDYGDIPDVECLPAQLNQVLLNLLVNAAQAIETQGTITIRTSADADEVRIAISDTGCGIAPEHLNRVFDPFFTTKPVGTGTGLGLSITYSIVRKHHGRIEVESEPGKGTTFRVILPIRQAPVAEAVAA